MIPLTLSRMVSTLFFVFKRWRLLKMLWQQQQQQPQSMIRKNKEQTVDSTEMEVLMKSLRVFHKYGWFC
jgi:hypothetical protein